MRRVLPLAVAAALLALAAACHLSMSGTGPDVVDASIVATDSGPTEAAVEIDSGPASITPSDPGVFACNGATCTAGQQRCCSDKVATNCRTFAQNCAGGEVDCDETADCPAGRLCCLGPDPGAFSYPSAMCFQTSCRVSDGVVCKSDAECDGGTCVAIKCGARSFGTCGGFKPTVCP